MTIDAAGNVSYDFEGHISADGIDLLAGENDAPPNDRKIIWHKTTMNGALVADLYAFNNPSAANSITLHSQAQDAFEQSSAVLMADSVSGQEGQLSVTQNDTPASASSFCRAWLDSGNVSRIICNAEKKSSFLQHTNSFGNPAVKADQVDYGTASFTWPGGTSLLTFTKAHTLIKQPIMCLATPGQDAGTGGMYIVIINSLSPTLIGFRCQTPAGFAPPAGTVSALHWLAIG
jgi:hypothetical protein